MEQTGGCDGVNTDAKWDRVKWGRIGYLSGINILSAGNRVVVKIGP